MADLLATWHVLLHEALLLLAFIIAVNGLDDLAVDLAYICLRLRRPAAPVLVPALAPATPPAFAILIPAWDEAAVIGPMLRRLLATQDWPDFTLFVGLYPNDPAGQAVVAAIADPRLRVAVNPRPGPTTKADCLNRLWAAMLAHEAQQGRRFAAVVLHDAEDVVHRLELALMAAHLAGPDPPAMVQLPVRPLIDPASPLVAGHYIDEFAQSHGKDLLVRQWLGAALPAAGVGVAFDRALMGRIAAAQGGRPFADDSLTEDYELGIKLHALGGRGVLVRHHVDGQLVATAEHFPATLAAAVRQKARWAQGISLAGWDRIGWRGGLANRWMLWRDRKGPGMALVSLAAYGLAGLIALDGLMRQWWPPAAALPPLSQGLVALLWWNFALLCWRLLLRALFTARVEGPVEALLATPRAAVGNIINALATLRALARYVAGLGRHGPPAWDKTVHRFPGGDGRAPAG
ncbi:MAG: glycosyl transferase family protein [Alphaproteobacteria bacterium]|nr:glycosyl transferase family protein [Alphaproteobacteria bacterium]